MIDFKKEVLKRKDEMIKDLQKLLMIPSELKEFNPNNLGAPFGLENKLALDYFLDLAKKDGFKTLNVDGYAGHIEYGDQKEFVLSIGHLDVVPAGSGWTYPPYEAQIHDNKIYARGAEDDKGPSMAIYYALKILKELNVKLSKRIKIVLGLDEESGWRCVSHYFKKYPEIPVSGFIPDADFPLIYAEKGITRTLIEGTLNDKRVISIQGGLRENMVPDYATIEINDLSFEHPFKDYLAKNNIKGETKKEGSTLKLTTFGLSAHGSLPEEGVNAISLLFKALKEIDFTNNLVEFINQYLTDDYLGKKFGISFDNQEMGPLTVNFGVIEFNNNRFKLQLNLRYPKGVDYQVDVLDKIIKLVKPFNFEASCDRHQKLLYVDPNSFLVQTLLKVYQKHTNDLTKPITTGGGTFARACPNLVAFGPHFLDKPSYIHQVDEYIDIDDLVKATIIYTEALYELAK